MKPSLKAPGTNRSKPKYDVLLSSLASNVNLRRYTLRAAAPVQLEHRFFGAQFLAMAFG